MIQLPFFCSCSEPKVHPKNWQSPKASLKKDWYVYYRFYDPVFKDNPKYKKGKLVIIKGMNQFKTISERQGDTQLTISNELIKLKERAFNPIKNKDTQLTLPLINIDASTSFIIALVMVEKRISASMSTKRDLKSTLKYVTKASIQLGYSELPIGSISRKHMKQLLLQIDISNGESPHRYNKIRSYLMILFKELIELEAAEFNPLRDLAKRKCVQRLRKLPTIENRKIINEYLLKHQYRFWLFMQIFFHSGARLTEMMQVRRKDVNLDKQCFMVTIKKGNAYEEVLKPIKNIALPFWLQALETANEKDFIFSKGLVPGKVAIQSYQITKRWNRHIKKKLEIDEDFYSLKHLNLDETATMLDINDASAMASHSSIGITAKFYAIGEKQRQNERLKQIQNPFA
jgi:site-specific recombinase XerC